MHARQPLILVIALCCAACSAAVVPPPEPPKKTVFDAQLKALEKAKAVQQTVDQQKVDTDKKIDEAEK
ncbi:MAG: hypothetical protein ABI846_15330 [Rudaea sp.]